MKKIITVLAILMIASIQKSFSQADSLKNEFAVSDTQDVRSTLFDTDDLFEISLKFDITKYKRARSDTMYLDAVLTYFNNPTDSVVKNIKVRARGNIRRTSSICDFPPLMLNFKMKDSRGTEFEGINKLKIVPYCKVGYEQYILKEYLVYKLFNVITDYSLRVRLFQITYINATKDKKPITQFGFAIEPVDLFEQRTKTKELEYSGITQRSLRKDMLDRVALFNYMIGNPDWSVPIKHNVILLTDAENAVVNENIIVAYDFDYAGLVNTDYSVPFESLPIKTVTERLYMAVCRSEQGFLSTIAEFAEKKDEFFRVINTFPYISERTRKEMINYLNGFFAGIDKRNTLVRKIMSDCIWFENQSNLRIR